MRVPTSAFTPPSHRSGRTSPARPAGTPLIPSAWGILACVLIGTFVAPLDISIVNIAMPTITVSYHAPVALGEWVALVYLLTTASLLMTHGRLADLFGASRLYIGGMVIFAAGSLACGLAPTLGWLIADRVGQAIGAGALIATGPAIITRAFPSTQRGRALGIHGMTVATGLATGPFLGGLLVDHVDWRAIFLINVPLGVVGALWAVRVLPRERRSTNPHFDVGGAFFLWATLFALLLFLSRGLEQGWQSTPSLLLLVAFAIGLMSFIWQERRSEYPMAALELFANRTFAAANVSSTLSFLAMYSVSFVLPFYLMGEQHQSAAAAGLTIVAMPAVMLVVAPFAGTLSDLIGSRLLTTAGLSCVTLAIALLATLGVGAGPVDVALRLALMGLGLGIFQAPNNSAIMGAVPRDRLGAASSMLGTMRHIGMVGGIAVSGAVLVQELPAQTFAALQSGHAAYAPALLGAYRHALLVALLFAGLATLVAALRGDPRLTSSRLRQSSKVLSWLPALAGLRRGEDS